MFLQAGLVTVMALWSGGCRSPKSYLRAADRETYSIISEKASSVPGMPASFSLEHPPGSPVASQVAEAARNGSTPTLSLADAIVVAAANNRDFQQQRENLYLKALGLTYQRYLFRPHFSAGLSGMFERSPADRSVSADITAGVTQALATGADVGLSLTSNFLRFLTGDPRESAESVLRFTFTQPLGRGAGKRIAQENLVQAERDVLYELRSFVRFRRDFFVSVARDYYRVLQQKDVVENERINMENLAAAGARAQMLFKEGRLPGVQVDQAEQDELRARDRWIRAERTYQGSLEEFKIKLGLPPDTPLSLDTAELEKLRAAQPVETTADREAVVHLGLARRLDLAGALDRVADAERKVAVAEDDLGVDIEVAFSAALGTEGPTKPLKFTGDEFSYSIGLGMDLPLDRLQERNEYRGSLIELDRKRRSLELLRDRVVQQVNQAWRKLEQARASYSIQLRSVALAEQRADSTAMLIEVGRAQIRDQLEAQEALVLARNALTGTLVDYRIAMLELWRDTEVLAFRDGQFTQETPDDEPGTEP